MAQTGFTPIQLYFSSTTTNVPLAANLANGELAINITDGKLFYKDNAAAVQVIGWKTVPATAGGTGQTSYAVGDLIYADTTTTLAKLPDVATGNALISGGVGVAPSWGKIGLTTHVSGTLPIANGGTAKTSFTANEILYGSFSQSSGLYFDGTSYVGIGTSTVNPQSVTTGITFDTPTAGNYFSLDLKTGGTLRTRLTGNNVATYFGTQTATPLYLETNGATTAVLFSSGGVSIGNTTDSGAGVLNTNSLIENTGQAWTAYTPTLAVDTGTITTSITNARYRQLGKTIFISLSISFTVTSGSPTEFRVSFPSSQVAPNNNQYTPVYMTFNSTAILGLARATVNSYGLQITPSNGLTFVGNCGFSVNTVFELN